jgi:hypothetical protein
LTTAVARPPLSTRGMTIMLVWMQYGHEVPPVNQAFFDGDAGRT